MGDLVEFLHSIQLEHLAEIFQQEEISLEILKQMTDGELKDIGVTKFGNRKAILNALEKINKAKDQEHYDTDDDGYDYPLCHVDAESGDDHSECKYSDFEEQEPLYDELFDTDKNNQQTEIARQVPVVPSRNAVVPCNAGEVQTDFFRKAEYGYSVGVYGTAFEQVSALFEGINLKGQKGKSHFTKIYQEIRRLWDKKEIFDELRKELVAEYGDISTFVSQGVEDLNDDSYPIVVTGETSAGKSSFVNLLLGVDILPQSSLSCTAAICRIHNYAKKKVTLTYKSGKQTNLDISSDINPREMKKILKEHVSIQSNEEAKSLAMGGDLLQFVDIWWPIEKIPKDLLIVDTPGVGPDDPHLTEKLYQYLPKALAFIYILNAPNAGGVQKDRILQIQEELAKYRSEDKTFFDPRRALFICNKWDQIHADEEDPDEVFEKIQQKLSESWYGFDPERSFKLSAREENTKSKAGKPISSEFKAILKGIKEMIPATVEEKLRRHLTTQKRFIESIQKNVTARIKTTMKSKDEKITMITKIKEKILNIEANISSKWHSVTEKAGKECCEVAKRITCHINDPLTKSKMLSWSSDDLPDGNDYGQLLEELDAIVKQRVAVEIKDRIQTFEAKRLESFVENLFRDECFTISKEVDEIKSYICGDDYGYAEHHITNDSIDFNDSGFTLEMREKVFLAVSSPVLVPAALVIGLVVGLFILPVGAGFVIKDKIKNMKKLIKYRKDKPALAKRRAEIYLSVLSQGSLEQQVKANLIENIKDRIDTFFSDIIPKRLTSAKALITNIENDLREPATIRATSQTVENLLRPVYGQILAAEMDVFGEQCIKTSDVNNVRQRGDVVIATFNYKKTNQQSVIKKITFGGDAEAGWKCLAEIHAFRRLRHHNLLKIYGVCMPEARDINEKLYILQEVYDNDLVHEAVVIKKGWFEINRYLQDALEGLSYLHISGLVHRNVRLESILIKDGMGKLAEIGEKKCGKVPAVRAPESRDFGEYGYEADIFQFGMVIWECWYHERAYRDSQTSQDVLNRIHQGERPLIKLPFPSDLEKCLQCCWHHNPNERPSAKQIQSLIAASHCTTTV